MANEKRLIDANTVEAKIEKIFRKLVANQSNADLAAALSYVGDLIIEAPTVDAVEVVHGRWLYDSNTERHFCSACTEEALSTSIDRAIYDYDWDENMEFSHIETHYAEHLTEYCPNCGAKIDGGNEDG